MKYNICFTWEGQYTVEANSEEEALEKFHDESWSTIANDGDICEQIDNVYSLEN